MFEIREGTETRPCIILPLRQLQWDISITTSMVTILTRWLEFRHISMIIIIATDLGHVGSACINVLCVSYRPLLLPSRHGIIQEVRSEHGPECDIKNSACLLVQWQAGESLKRLIFDRRLARWLSPNSWENKLHQRCSPAKRGASPVGAKPSAR